MWRYVMDLEDPTSLLCSTLIEVPATARRTKEVGNTPTTFSCSVPIPDVPKPPHLNINTQVPQVRLAPYQKLLEPGLLHDPRARKVIPRRKRCHLLLDHAACHFPI